MNFLDNIISYKEQISSSKTRIECLRNELSDIRAKYYTIEQSFDTINDDSSVFTPVLFNKWYEKKIEMEIILKEYDPVEKFENFQTKVESLNEEFRQGLK